MLDPAFLGSDDHRAMLSLMSAVDELRMSRDRALSGMLLAIECLGRGLPEEERRAVARSVYILADKLAAPEKKP